MSLSAKYIGTQRTYERMEGKRREAFARKLLDGDGMKTSRVELVQLVKEELFTDGVDPEEMEVYAEGVARGFYQDGDQTAYRPDEPRKGADVFKPAKMDKHLQNGSINGVYLRRRVKEG